MAEQDKPAKVTPKDQGVPAEYLNDEGTAFKIGMDARLKSDLVNSALGLITKSDPGESKHVFSEKEAVALLEKRGWTHFLDRKRDLEKEKAEKKAKAQAEREAKAKEKAEEKERKAAEKKAAADAKKSDSKSSSKKGGSSKTDQLREQREAQAAAQS